MLHQVYTYRAGAHVMNGQQNKKIRILLDMDKVTETTMRRQNRTDGYPIHFSKVKQSKAKVIEAQVALYMTDLTKAITAQ